MLTTLTLFIALFLTTLTMMVGAGLLGSLLSLRMNIEGFSEPTIGVILSGFYIGLVIGSFICPSIVRRAGHIRAFAVFAAINTATTLLYPLLISPYLMTGKINGNELFPVVVIFLVLSLVPVALTRSISPTLPEVLTMKMSELLFRAPMGLLG